MACGHGVIHCPLNIAVGSLHRHTLELISYVKAGRQEEQLPLLSHYEQPGLHGKQALYSFEKAG